MKLNKTFLFRNGCLAVAFALGAQFTSAQDAGLEAIKSAFAQYSNKTLHEKLYVHTDKNFYMAGDIAWFSIYNVDASMHKPLDISALAYVEILDQQNKPVQQGKIRLEQGKGSGSFHLPISLNSGNYKLRAYTNLMKNSGADYFFEKQITIVNSLKTINATTASPATVQAAFFPEGGNLVANLTSQVAFKVTDAYGKGIDFSGVVLNEKNDTVALLKPFKFGIGRFELKPVASGAYKAVIRTNDGKIATYNLPAIQQQGYVIRAEEVGENLKLTVTTNLPAMNGRQVYLLVHARQVMSFAKSSSLREGIAEFYIPKEQLKDGISHFTLFNDSKQPVCERLFFCQPKQKLVMNAQVDKPAHNTREKAAVNVIAKDEQGRSSASPALSVSVYKMDSLTAGDEGSILSYLWLTSDLKGKIESPDYYLTQPGPEVSQAVDNLMLTHGWRKFNWQNILDNKAPSFEFIPEHHGNIVTAKATDSRTGAPAQGVTVYLAIPGTGSQLYISETNDKGEVLFDVWGHYGSGEMVLQTNRKKDSIYSIDVRSPFYTSHSATPLKPFSLNENFQQTLLAHSVSMQVQQAFYSDTLERFSNANADSTAFYGKADRAYLIADYTRFTTVEEVLTEYVPEVSLIRKGGQPVVRVFVPADKASNRDGYYMEDEPLVLYDGIPVFNTKFVAYDPVKVRKLEVVRNKYVLGPASFDGIINFTTHNLNMEGLQLDPGTIVLDYEGLQLKREFYSPDYDNEKARASTLPDLRNLLFWSPDVVADAEGKASVQFFTSDLNGKYIGVIEGLDKNGRAGRTSFVFEVKGDKGL